MIQEIEYFQCPVCENHSPSCTICAYYRHKALRKPYQIIAEHIRAHYEKGEEDVPS